MADMPIAIGTRIVDDSADRYTLVEASGGDNALIVEHWPDMHNPGEYEVHRVELHAAQIPPRGFKFTRDGLMEITVDEHRSLMHGGDDEVDRITAVLLQVWHARAETGVTAPPMEHCQALATALVLSDYGRNP